MLKIEANMKEPDLALNLEINGDVRTLATETSVVIRQIYQGIQETNPTAAALYKALITRFVTEPDSPAWKEDSDDAEM